MWASILLAMVLRLALIVYGEWQDQTMAVKFTDVDYFVFSDAADFVLEGKSPYNRSTYRYTPLLAWMLLPNAMFGPAFGKVLFVIFDIGTGLLIYLIMRSRGHNSDTCKWCSFLWIFNPLPGTVSCRGNAESIMTFLVLLCLKLLSEKRTKLAAVTYAVSVHFKIYPLTYCLPFYFLLNTEYSEGESDKSSDSKKGLIGKFKRMFLLNKKRMELVMITVAVLVTLTSAFYYIEGWDFLEHSYLYHVTRKDVRHNFSLYFYMLYLLAEDSCLSWISLLLFLPQCILLFSLSWKFYRDPPFCWFLHTFVFVIFNKVCTSQYFLWYLCLLPLVIPNLRISLVKGVTLIFIWFLGQGLWLLPAYYLEFEGFNTYIYLWVSGVIFFLINIYIANTLMLNYHLQNWCCTKVAKNNVLIH